MKPIALHAAYAVLIMSGVAFAQAPVPLQRSIESYEPFRATASSEPQQTPVATAPAAQRNAAKDRYGKEIRGDTCAAHWANCAYNPQAATR